MMVSMKHLRITRVVRKWITDAETSSLYSVFVFSWTGMARKEEHLTPGQKILAIRFVSLYLYKNMYNSVYTGKKVVKN